MRKLNLVLLVPMFCVGMLISAPDRFIQGLAYAEERSVTVKQKRDLSVEAKETANTAFRGKYYALIIGNNDYKYIPKLETARKDAVEVERLLKERYGFETKLLLDAKRKDILSTINEFRKNLSVDDSFLVYYAGHGEFDKTADKAYWLPVDAQRDDPTDWIMADDLTTNVKRIGARHVLIVADSCYSGTMTRSFNADLLSKGGREEFLKKMRGKTSRTLMASGGNEPVADSGGAGHSVFADTFLKALREVDKTAFTAEELFHGFIKERVAGKSEQTPEYNTIKNSGHDGGDFVFQVKTASLGSISTPSTAVLPPSIPVEAPLPPAPVVLQGHLQVNVNAPSSKVYVNGEDKGTASPGNPLNMENFPTGTVSVRVEAEGYESLQRTVNIQRNQWTQEVFELKRVQVASLPPPPSPQIKTPPLTKGDEGGFNMALIPSGEFMAGSPASLKGMVINAFYIDKYEVTQREYEQVMGKNPSYFKGSDRPVESVTWYEADEYCRKVGKRLPTEWEWEKAAKAGTTTTYYWGNEVGKNNANCDGCGSRWDNKETAPVGSFKPNAYGLYDMAGNVWEWTSSDYDNSGKYKTLRGGSWSYNAYNVRSSNRNSNEPDDRYGSYGFRCVQ